MRPQASSTNPLSRDDALRILREALPELRRDYGVVRLALYGSFARGEPTPGSDVDLLVEFSRPAGLIFIDLACYLEEKLGRKVDLATFGAFYHATEQPYRQELGANILGDLTDVEAAPG